MRASSHLKRVVRQRPLATEQGITAIVELLLFGGDMCPECGFGTRKTSKRWARCQRCGKRVERKELPNTTTSGKEDG